LRTNAIGYKCTHERQILTDIRVFFLQTGLPGFGNIESAAHFLPWVTLPSPDTRRGFVVGSG
jgi:hypothetical protein